jgi:hypothetical protein
LNKVIYCATSYANTCNIYKNKCVRPVKKFHIMYLLISPDNQTVYGMELVDISGAKVNNIWKVKQTEHEYKILVSRHQWI